MGGRRCALGLIALAHKRRLRRQSTERKRADATGAARRYRRSRPEPQQRRSGAYRAAPRHKRHRTMTPEEASEIRQMAKDAADRLRQELQQEPGPLQRHNLLERIEKLDLLTELGQEDRDQ